MSELRTGLPHTDFLSPRPEILPKTYTEAEVQAMVAAAVMEAAEACFWTDTGFHDGMSGDWHPISAGDALASAKASIRALIKPDAMAALEAHTAREVTKALEEAADLRDQIADEIGARPLSSIHSALCEYSNRIRAMIPEVKP